jgi:hypothetical protein
MPAIEAFVVEEPSVDILHDGADGSEPGTVFDRLVPDHGPDALAPAEPAILGAVVAGIPCPGSGCAAAARGGARSRGIAVPTARGRHSSSENIMVC